MPLDPEQIRNRSFDSVPKGYDRDAVDDFLEKIAAEFERLLGEAEAGRAEADIADSVAERLEELARELRGDESVITDPEGEERPPDPVPQVESRTDFETPGTPLASADRDGEEVARGESAPPSAATPDGEAARLVALNLALSGEGRDAVAAHLKKEFGLADSGALLDEVYARVG